MLALLSLPETLCYRSGLNVQTLPPDYISSSYFEDQEQVRRTQARVCVSWMSSLTVSLCSLVCKMVTVVVPVLGLRSELQEALRKVQVCLSSQQGLLGN